MIVGSVVVALLFAGGVLWLLDSTVPASEYDEVVAALDSAAEEIDESQRSLAETQRSLEESQRSLEESQRSLEESERARAESDAALSRSRQALAESERSLSEAENELLAADKEVAAAHDTVAAYEDGTVEFWTLVLAEGGFDDGAAGCVARAMVDNRGPATLAVFAEFALAGDDAIPPVGFQGAMDDCGVSPGDFSTVPEELVGYVRPVQVIGNALPPLDGASIAADAARGRRAPIIRARTSRAEPSASTVSRQARRWWSSTRTGARTAPMRSSSSTDCAARGASRQVSRSWVSVPL
jgi:hypothetical protein